ncbi:MAG: hypothetical protein P4M09_17390 [Devosia sp.]|nr:hypothetical protein [Devosia sp.]
MFSDLTTSDLIDAIKRRQRRGDPPPLDLQTEAMRRGLIIINRF